MLKVGLTGGIGCGKSTAVDAFRVLDIPIVDADQISKTMVAAGSPALTAIAQALGTDLLLNNGELNRALLKQKIFSDPAALATLEFILHPRIKSEIQRQIEALEGTAPYVVVDIPLLVEKEYQILFDYIVVVDCTTQQQIQRVSMRDDLSELDIKKIMKKQANREYRKQQASHILDNTEDKASLILQVSRLHQKMLALAVK